MNNTNSEEVNPSVEINVGDEIEINDANRPEISQQKQIVLDDGFISPLEVGQVHVAGKTVDQVNQVDALTWIIQKRIVQAFKRKMNLDKSSWAKAPAKPKVPRAPPVTSQNRVDRLNNLGHKIHFDGKWYRC